MNGYKVLITLDDEQKRKLHEMAEKYGNRSLHDVATAIVATYLAIQDRLGVHPDVEERLK